MPWLLLSGVLSGLAFLMRPEGAGMAVTAATGALLLTKRCQLPRRLMGPLIVILGAALVASPYMLVTGKLVQKKSIFQFLIPGSCEAAEPAFAGWPGFSEPGFMISDTPNGDRTEEPLTSHFSLLTSPALQYATLGSVPTDLAKAAGLVLEHWGRALRGTLLLPAIAWLFLRKRLPADRTAARLVAAAGSLHFLIVVMLVLRFDYTDLLSVRHTMILAGLTLPFSAAGVAAMLELIPARRRTAAGALVLVALVTPTVPWMLERRYAHEAYLRRAGEWIRSQQPAGAKVHTTRHRVAFYANGVHQWSPRDETVDIPRILAEARTHRPNWLVFDVQRVLRYSPSFLQDLQKVAGPGELTPVHVEEQTVRRRVQRAIVYRYRPPA